MEFDWSAARFFFDLAQLIGLVLLGLYTHMTQRGKANATAITTLGERTHGRIEMTGQRVDGLERRISVMESQLTQAPTHQDLAILHKRVTKAAEQMESLSGEFRATNRQLGLIHEHLLNTTRRGE